MSIFKTLMNDTCFTATGAGRGDFFMAVVALANGLTADKAGVVFATVAAITATTCTFHVIAFRYADVVTARQNIVSCADRSASGAMIFILTFIVVALAKQVTAEGAGLVVAAVADVCKASGALVVIASLAGLVITV